MSTQQNKELITRYNSQVIEAVDMELLKQIASPEFINHSAPQGMDAGINGMIIFFSKILRTAFPDLKVEILDMVAEDNKVSTRKRITGTHLGELMGIQPTQKPVAITLIDIITVENGQIKEHWGENNFASVIQQLKQ